MYLQIDSANGGLELPLKIFTSDKILKLELND